MKTLVCSEIMSGGLILNWIRLSLGNSFHSGICSMGYTCRCVWFNADRWLSSYSPFGKVFLMLCTPENISLSTWEVLIRYILPYDAESSVLFSNFCNLTCLLSGIRFQDVDVDQPVLTKYGTSLLGEARGEIRHLYVFLFVVVLELCLLIMFCFVLFSFLSFLYFKHNWLTYK